MSLYALNLFDLADNHDYLAYLWWAYERLEDLRPLLKR
jgi:hypothetical protein